MARVLLARDAVHEWGAAGEFAVFAFEPYHAAKQTDTAADAQYFAPRTRRFSCSWSLINRYP